MDATSNPAAPPDPDAVSGPLTELTECLAAGDLETATALLRDTRWTSLSNVLRSLPEPDRVTMIALLDPPAAHQVLHDLTEEEIARLRIAQSTPVGEE
jgi:Mg/Co/Ni transporter MgtE